MYDFLCLLTDLLSLTHCSC